jgi:hypothetical protein
MRHAKPSVSGAEVKLRKVRLGQAEQVLVVTRFDIDLWLVPYCVLYNSLEAVALPGCWYGTRTTIAEPLFDLGFIGEVNLLPELRLQLRKVNMM